MKDLKALIPYFKEELAKGRTLRELASEKEFNESQYQNMAYYLRRDNVVIDKPPIIRPEKPKRIESFVQDGKTWYDITPFIVDCGG